LEIDLSQLDPSENRVDRIALVENKSPAGLLARDL
jgi:hypothetical protein